MPWDSNKDQVLLSVGVLEAWVQSKKGAEEYSYERLWHKNFKSQAICIEWNEEMNVVAAGCDNGTLVLLSFNPQSPLKYKEILNQKVNSSRIMGLYLDATRNQVFTIGEDKYLRCTDLKSKETISSCKVSDSKLTCFKVDPLNQVGFISDRKGNIHVYDLLNVPISPLLTPEPSHEQASC